MPQLIGGELTETSSLALATVGAATQTVGGAALVLGVGPRLTALALQSFMGVAVHWQLRSRGRPVEDLFLMNCDGKGLGPGWFVLGYTAILALGPGRLRLLSRLAPT
jgi:uncharacterized membrane protein YphA (DoxX/SURF4 family)